jgi:hypothetical protein
VPGDVLRQMRPGDGLLIHGTLRPAHLRGRFYYAEKGLRRLAGEEAVAAAAASLGPPPPAGPVATAPSPTGASAGPPTVTLGGIDAPPPATPDADPSGAASGAPTAQGPGG